MSLPISQPEAVPRQKVALLINMIAPARLPIYAGLSEHFDLLVLHGGTEANRDSWHNIDEKLPKAIVIKAWGWQIQIPRRKHRRVFDRRYLHVTPGFAWH